MKEQLWSTARRTGELLDLANEMIWDDTAAREIRTRFLNPLEQESKDMLASYRDQYEAIEAARAKISVMQAQQKEADKAGAALEKRHQQVQQELLRAQQEADQSNKQNGSAQALLPRVQTLLDQAATAGNR